MVKLKIGFKNYLLIYNFVQLIGFSTILCIIGFQLYHFGTIAIAKTYSNVHSFLKIFQTVQYLEVIHPIIGFTTGSALVPLLQITGRIFIIFTMVDIVEPIQTHFIVFVLIVIWSTIEIIRYSYYITVISKMKIKLLTWLRYSMWIPLFPMGIFCELIIIFKNIAYFEKTGMFTIMMPNSWNVTFGMPIFMKMYFAILLFPIFYLLMSHMYVARTIHLSCKNK